MYGVGKENPHFAGMEAGEMITRSPASTLVVVRLSRCHLRLPVHLSVCRRKGVIITLSYRKGLTTDHLTNLLIYNHDRS